MNQPNSLLEAALGYAQRGWHVFPCSPGQKKPLLSKKQGGNGCLDGTTDENKITKWWTDYPTANIGLLCGKASGVYVVDVDLDLDKGVNGWETLRTLLEEGKSLPPTLIQDSPRGGAHYIYRTDNPPANKNNFMPGIDIRGDNYYIMLAPSLHPNGKEYAWRESSLLINIAEFPDFMRPEKKELKVVPPWEQKKRPIKKKSGPDSMILERASAYLSECDPAIQGSGGHDALLWAARSMVIGFDLSDSAALSLLWSEYNPRCIPSWDQNNSADVKDFERKVKQARDTNKKKVGWLLDECGLRTGSDAEQIIELGREIANRLMGDYGEVPEPVFISDTSFDVEELEKVEPETERKKTVKSEAPPFLKTKRTPITGVFSEEILNPPGFVGDLCRWINATAGCPQPLLSLGAALCAAGALFGRKVRDQSNGRTNLYAMGVAHSSAGKDHPAKCIRKLFTAAGAAHLLGGSRVTSESAIEVALMSSPVQLFTWDEIGHMFAAIKSAGSGNGAHLQTIVPCLMELYSSAGDLYIGKQKAEGDARRVDQPNVCVWGLTSPDILYQGISKEQLRDGWLGRVMTMISHDRPKYKMTESIPPPKHLIEEVQRWLRRDIPAPEGTGDITSAIVSHQILVPASKLANRVLNKFIDECHTKMIRGSRIGDDTQYLWGKACENARRVALIIAAGENYEDPEISESNALYACELIRLTIKMFGESIGCNMSENQWESEKLKVLNVITLTEKEGASKTWISRKTQFIRGKRTRDDYLSDLLEAGLIDVGLGENGKTCYWVHPLGVEAKIRQGAEQ